MTFGERNQMLWYEDESQRLRKGLLGIRGYLTEKHPEILKEYDDYRLAEFIGLSKGGDA